MQDQRFSFWQKWLTYANVMTIGVGFVVAFAGNSIFLEPHNAGTRELLMDGAELPANMMILKNWLFGVIGGTIIGFHFLMVMISEFAFKKKEKWAYQACCVAMLSWFVVDSSISIYTGAVHNVLLINIFALVVIGIPLVMTYKVFYK